MSLNTEIQTHLFRKCLQSFRKINITREEREAEVQLLVTSHLGLKVMFIIGSKDKFKIRF